MKSMRLLPACQRSAGPVSEPAVGRALRNGTGAMPSRSAALQPTGDGNRPLVDRHWRRWSQEEDDLLIEYCFYPQKVLQKLLADVLGSNRSSSAIKRRRGEIGASRTRPGLSLREFAVGLGWPENRMLRSLRNGELRAIPSTGNGWFVSRKEMRRFVRTYLRSIDLARVEPAFFVDMWRVR